MSMDRCGEHGWWEIDRQETSCPSCEIARLHAEVERLKFCTNCHDLTIMRQEEILKREQAERERYEAVAQVAVLLTHVSKFPSEDAGFYFDHIGGCQYPHGGRCSCGMETWSDEWERIKENLPAKAHALLDRLQQVEFGYHQMERAEAVAEAAKTFATKFATLQSAISSAFLLQKIHGVTYRGETYVEEWLALQKALAAWEEGKK